RHGLGVNRLLPDGQGRQPVPAGRVQRGPGDVGHPVGVVAVDEEAAEQLLVLAGPDPGRHRPNPPRDDRARPPSQDDTTIAGRSPPPGALAWPGLFTKLTPRARVPAPPEPPCISASRNNGG